MYVFITFVAWACIYGLLPKATGKQPYCLATAASLVGHDRRDDQRRRVFHRGNDPGLNWAQGDPFISSETGRAVLDGPEVRSAGR